jgi:hypothetical protein
MTARMRHEIIEGSPEANPAARAHSLTMVFNPNARKPKLKPPSLDNLRRAVGPSSCIHVTETLEELDRLMREWKEPDDTLCFYGGDGSIARGLTAWVRHQGENAQVPPVLAVRAGTINMLCSILGFHETVETTLERWSRNELTAIHRIPLMKVEVEGREPIYGFIFAWGVGFRFLREYYGRTPIPDVRDAVVVLLKAMAGALRPDADRTPFYRHENIRLAIDGVGVDAPLLRSLAVGTIARASLGIRPFAPVPIEAGSFHVNANGMSLPRVVWHSPTLLFGMGDNRRLAQELGNQLITRVGCKVLECELTEGFTMDGEMYEIEGKAKVKITPGPLVPFWTREGTPL